METKRCTNAVPANQASAEKKSENINPLIPKYGPLNTKLSREDIIKPNMIEIRYSALGMTIYSIRHKSMSFLRPKA